MSSTDSPSIEPELAERLAVLAGAGADREGFPARAPISEAVIRQMTDAVGDRNPVYTDEAFASRSVHRGIVAPPLWLYGWMMRGLEPHPERATTKEGIRYFHLAPAGQQRPGSHRRTLREELNELLESFGYASPAVTNMTYGFRRYLRPGEQPRFSSWVIDRIQGPKVTKIGTGFFVDLRINVFVGEELVATIGQRYLRSKPQGRSPAPAAAAAPRDGGVQHPLPELDFSPDAPSLTTRRFDQVRVGEALPDLLIRISPTLVIAGALASQDFQDVHHDHQIMERRGHPDIFMNMMTTSGLLGRYLTDWTGPEALIRAHELRLGRPNYAGDTLRLSGTVRSAQIVDGARLVTVDIVGRNGLGTHAEGSVSFELP